MLFLPCFSSEQSIADLNRSSNGGSSKRISLDSSHLDSSRDTDTGTPFSSPPCKVSKPASDTEDRWGTQSYNSLHLGKSKEMI